MTSPIHSSSPSPLTQLIAIRHGETSWNRTARYQGQEDIALNEAGFSQAHDIAQALSETPLDALYTSDLKRAYQTAAALALPAVCLPELREQHFGVFQGFTGTEIAQRWPDAPEFDSSKPRNSYIPNGINRLAVLFRILVVARFKL